MPSVANRFNINTIRGLSLVTTRRTVAGLSNLSFMSEEADEKDEGVKGGREVCGPDRRRRGETGRWGGGVVAKNGGGKRKEGRIGDDSKG